MSTAGRRLGWYFGGCRILARNLVLALDRADSLTAEAITIDREIGNAYGDLGFDLGKDLDIGRALGRARRRADGLTNDLARGHDPVRTYGRARDLASGLQRVLGLIGDDTCELAQSIRVALDLANDLARAAHVGGQSRAGRVASSAAGLLAAAVRLLPAAERARYAEEYRAELWDLTQAGAGRIRQLRYALRQLLSAPAMRFALQSPRRRSAGL